MGVAVVAAVVVVVLVIVVAAPLGGWYCYRRQKNKDAAPAPGTDIEAPKAGQPLGPIDPTSLHGLPDPRDGASHGPPVVHPVRAGSQTLDATTVDAQSDSARLASTATNGTLLRPGTYAAENVPASAPFVRPAVPTSGLLKGSAIPGHRPAGSWAPVPTTIGGVPPSEPNPQDRLAGNSSDPPLEKQPPLGNPVRPAEPQPLGSPIRDELLDNERDEEVGGGMKWFKLKEIRRATAAFSETRKLGEGGFGPVYAGRLDDGKRVAVKRGANRLQGQREFFNEWTVMAGLEHENLVPLLGGCQEQGEFILVYEFLPNGTLREHLQGEASSRPLSLHQRLRILADTARGLSYLHSQQVIHRDVKAENILLTSDFHAKVSDYGLSKLLPNEDVSMVWTQVRGTDGYLDPLYGTDGQLTDRSDVFSFGVVILEMLTGRIAFDASRSTERSLAVYARRTLPQQLFQLIDKSLEPYVRDSASRDVANKLAVLAMSCIGDTRYGRPKMSRVVRELEGLLVRVPE